VPDPGHDARAHPGQAASRHLRWPEPVLRDTVAVRFQAGNEGFSAQAATVPFSLVCGIVGHHCPGLMRTMSTNARKGAGT